MDCLQNPCGWAMAMVVVVLGSSLRADDWPQWRGPNRDGVWHETGLVDRFEAPELEHRWRAEISSGYSGPTVADGRVFVSDRLVEGNDQYERVHCFDAADGATLWTHSYSCPYRNISYQAGPRGSVTIFDRRAYSLGTMGNLVCLSVDGGEVLWSRDLNTEYNIRMPNWGIACSPLIAGDLVIVQIGGSDGACVVAFNRQTGVEAWRALADPASYSSPILVEQAGHVVLVCWTGARVVGLDPADGALFWDYHIPPTSWVRACASPVWQGERILLTGFFSGSHMLRLQSDEPAIDKLWSRTGPDEKHTEALHANFAEPFVRNGFIYGVDSYGEVRCLDAGTGRRIWESLDVVPRQRWSTARFIRSPEHDWIFTERGELVIARLSPEGYREISRTKVIEPTKAQLPSRREGVVWAHPGFANRKIYARNDEALVCVDLAAE